MNEQLCFADVDLPFHVWVRESGAKGFRWVLRDASHDLRESADRCGGSCGFPASSLERSPRS